MIAGRVWKFGDNINTEMMLPMQALYLPEQDRVRYVFQSVRPGWVDQMQPGDFIIGGQNYGTGSSRPAALQLRGLGVGCLIAESINDLFFRNAVNFGLLALECPGIHAAFEEGQTAEISTEDFTVRNRQTGVVLNAGRLPRNLVALMCERHLSATRTPRADRASLTIQTRRTRKSLRRNHASLDPPRHDAAALRNDCALRNALERL